MPKGGRPDLKSVAHRVIQLLEPEFRSLGYDLLDVRVFMGGGRVQLRVYVDLAGGGITMDQVTKASRTAGFLLEEADLFDGQYVLEVSSPGIRRPLRTLEHFKASVGQEVDLKMERDRALPAEGITRVQGRLISVTDQGCVTVAVPGAEGRGESEVTVELDRLREGNLNPEFDVQAIINADRKARKQQKQERRRNRPGRKKSRPRAGRKEDPA